MLHVPAPSPPAPVPFEVPAEDGYTIRATLFAPPRPPVGTVLIHGATAVPQSYYRRFAAFLAERGQRVVTYDYRGVGASRPANLRGFAATMTDWARLDAAAVHRWASRRHGDGPLALVGHSFGGQLLGLIDEARDAAGALLVGAQLGAVLGSPPLRRAAYGAFFRTLVPAAIWAAGYLPGWAGLGEDLPAGVAAEWARWCLHPEYLFSGHADARARFAAFRRPVVHYTFADDAFAPEASVRDFCAALSGADLERRHHDLADFGVRVGHFGFFRPAFARRFWGGAAAWLDAVLRGEPPPRDVLITEEELAQDLGYA